MMSRCKPHARRKPLTQISPSGQTLTSETYEALRAQLLSTYPDVQEELERAVSSLCKPAMTISTLWNAFGSKPLFSNTRLTVSREYTKAWDGGVFPTMEDFLLPEWEIQYKPIAKKGWRSNSCYTAKQKSVAELQSRMKREGYPSVSISRLYAMRSAAHWLHQRTERVGDACNLVGINLEGCSDAGSLYKAVAPLSYALGVGWGQTTVFHALVDAGFEVVKPDIHVTRTLAFFNELPNSEMACKRSRNYLASPYGPARVVHAARELASRVQPLLSSNGRTHREVDIVLLYASAKDLLTSQ